MAAQALKFWWGSRGGYIFWVDFYCRFGRFEKMILISKSQKVVRLEPHGPHSERRPCHDYEKRASSTPYAVLLPLKYKLFHWAFESKTCNLAWLLACSYWLSFLCISNFSVMPNESTFFGSKWYMAKLRLCLMQYWLAAILSLGAESHWPNPFFSSLGFKSNNVSTYVPSNNYIGFCLSRK